MEIRCTHALKTMTLGKEKSMISVFCDSKGGGREGLLNFSKARGRKGFGNLQASVEERVLEGGKETERSSRKGVAKARNRTREP